MAAATTTKKKPAASTIDAYSGARFLRDLRQVFVLCLFLKQNKTEH
jgi:hypothetical protein